MAGSSRKLVFFHNNSLSGSSDSRGTSTLFVNIDSKESPHTSCRGDAFEISLPGMSVSADDTINLEVVSFFLYSLTRNFRNVAS